MLHDRIVDLYEFTAAWDAVCGGPTADEQPRLDELVDGLAPGAAVLDIARALR